IGVLVAIGLIGFLFIPPLVDQVNHFSNRVPDYLHDLTKGRGRLGFLERKYHIVEKVKQSLHKGGATKLFGLSGTAISITNGVVTLVVASVTIAFMTFFMLLEGPKWVERGYALFPDRSRPRWQRVGRDIYATVGGYV